MSKLLFDESPLVVQPTLAKAIGLNEAIVLQQLHYWLTRDKIGKEIDGVRWMWNSLSDWQKNFPWWSESTVSRALQSLEEQGLIKTGCFNQRKGDRTKWFTIAYDQVAEVERGGVETPSSHNETSTSQDETTLPETTSESTSVVETPTDETEVQPHASPAELEIEQIIFGLGWRERQEIREIAEKDVGLEALKEALSEFREKVIQGEYRANWGTLKKFWSNTISTKQLRASALVEPPPNGNAPAVDMSRVVIR